MRRENNGLQSGTNAQAESTLSSEGDNFTNHYIGGQPYAMFTPIEGNNPTKTQDESDAESNTSEHTEKLTEDEVRLFPNIWRKRRVQQETSIGCSSEIATMLENIGRKHRYAVTTIKVIPKLGIAMKRLPWKTTKQP